MFSFQKISWCHIGLLTLFVIVTYANTLGHDFVWDDSIFVTHCSAAYQQFDLSTIFLTLSANGLEYLPVRDVSYALDFALWGRNPVGFHFSNVLIFFLNVIVVYFLTIRIVRLWNENFRNETTDKSRQVAFGTAALFAVHPINGEVVNFVTMRNSLLCCLFFFLSCYAYLLYLASPDGSKRRWYIGALVFCVCTFFSKATGIILPLILAIVTCAFSHPKRLATWLPLLPFMLLSGCVFILFKHVATLSNVMDPVHNSDISETLYAKITTAAQIPFFYLYKMLIPFGYSVDYDIGKFGEGLADPRVFCSIIALSVFISVAWIFRRREPLILFCLAWYLIVLIPVLHFFPTHPVVADRYAFLATYPIFLLFSISYLRFLKRFTVGLWLPALMVMLFLAFSTYKNNAIWKNDKSLWEYTVATAPHSDAAHVNLARLYFIEENNYDKGLELADKARRLNPLDTNYDVFMGVLHLREKDPESAIADFNRALEKNNQHIETLVNMALAYQMLGVRTLALECLQRAVNSTEPSVPGDLRETAGEMLREITSKTP
jgi:hypothetical protein